MKRSKLFQILLLILGLAQYATGAELYELNPSIRALGMGNAFTAVVDDADSLFYNPAGLGRVRGVHITFFDPHVGLDSKDFIDAAQNIQDQSKISSEIQKQFGKNYWAGGGAKASIAIQNFAAAVYDGLDASLGFLNPAYPQVSASLVNDYGLAVGAAIDSPFFIMGATGRRVSRYGGRTVIGPDTISLLSATALKAKVDNRGTGYALDLGMLLKVPVPATPRLSFVVKNFGQTTFTSDFGTGRVPDDAQEMIAGFAFDLMVPSVLRVTPSIDFAYLDRQDEQLGKKVHLGVEVELPLLTLRGGFNQGYYTAGAGLDLGVLRFDAATYGVELGAYPGQKEDRRYMIQFTFEIGFGTSSLSSGGEDGGSNTGSVTKSIFNSRHVKARR